MRLIVCTDRSAGDIGMTDTWLHGKERVASTPNPASTARSRLVVGREVALQEMLDGAIVVRAGERAGDVTDLDRLHSC